MTKFLQVSFLLLCTLCGWSQSKSDSLLILYGQSEDWDEKAATTYEFCKLNLGSNPDKCLELYNQIEGHHAGLTDSIQLYNLYNVKGVIYQYRHNIDSSNIYLLRAFELSKLMQDSSLMVKSIGNLSINYRNESDFQKAIEFSLISLKYYQNSGDTVQWANCLAEIGNSYILLGNTIEGISNQRKALRLFKLKNYWRGIGNVNSSLAYIKFNSDDLDSAVYYTELAIDAHEKSGDVFGMASAKHSLCTYYGDLGRTSEEQFECVSELLELDRQIQNREGIMLDYLNLSRILNNQAKYEEAIELNKEALQIAKELEDRRVMYECYTSLAIKLNNVNEFESAYLYLDTAHVLHQEFLNIDIQNAVLEADKKYQVAEKEKELLRVNQEKSALDLEVSERNNQLLLLSGGILLILLLGGFIFYRIRQLQKDKLSEIRIEEQQKGLAAVIQVQEDERKRIAKDLHDGIVQQLGGLKLALQKVFTHSETQESSKILAVLDNSVEELRELSHKMMPRSLEEFGLVPALSDMLENSLGNTSIAYNFEQFGINDRLKENVEIAIYRIAQELVNNVIKHSMADKVNIQLFIANQHVILIVEDNGHGILKEEGKKGIGLMNIASRLDTINGNVNIEPSPSSGTLATVKIPV